MAYNPKEFIKIAIPKNYFQVHVKEAHSVVKPQSNKEDEENGTNGNFHQEPIPKKQIYSCRSCERKFQDHQEFIHHQQFEHFECDNCYKYFSMVSRTFFKSTFANNKKVWI